MSVQTSAALAALILAATTFAVAGHVETPTDSNGYGPAVPTVSPDLIAEATPMTPS